MVNFWRLYNFVHWVASELLKSFTPSAFMLTPLFKQAFGAYGHLTGGKIKLGEDPYVCLFTKSNCFTQFSWLSDIKIRYDWLPYSVG